MNKTELDKIIIKLDENDWHGYANEILWGKATKEKCFFIKNIPFYAKGISIEDMVCVENKDNQLYYKKTTKKGGHSTYRIFVLEEKQDSEFNLFWKPLEKIGCSYEKATEKLIAVDVPPETSIHKAYELLENGEKANFWEFEEGHCGHPLN